MHIIDKLLTSAYQDSELLKKRNESGDVFNAFRDVDFCIDARVEETDGIYRVITVTNTPVTQSIISGLSANMVSVATIFGCEFNGWGAVEISENDL